MSKHEYKGNGQRIDDVADVTGYLTPKEAAQRKGVSLAAIYKAIERGQIPASRILNRVALTVSDVEAWQPAAYTKDGEARQGVYKPRGPGRPAKAKIGEGE